MLRYLAPLVVPAVLIVGACGPGTASEPDSVAVGGTPEVAATGAAAAAGPARPGAIEGARSTSSPSPTAAAGTPASDASPAPAGSGTATSIAPTAAAGPRRTIDLLRVTVGDGKISTSARAGYVWRCGGGAGGPGGGASTKGPWFNSDGTYNVTAKAIVDGEVAWPSTFTASKAGSTRTLTGNALPDHTTGRFPVQPTDDAYRYDRNPNTISAHTVSLSMPADPQVASQPSCLAPPFIAVLTSGSVVFDALDALGRDAGAWETQDQCAGHPERTGQYHYHTVTGCIPDPGGGHSTLLGWAVDGFGIFGVRGEAGEVLTNDDLDACHGHTHEIDWDGRRVSMYHYHATYEYPYTLGCFRGTPARLR